MAPSYEDDKAAILSTINSFLATMRTRQISSMRQYIIPEGGGVFERDNEIIKSTLSVMVDRLEKRMADFPADAVIDETIHDTVVMVDENLGTVWAPFHCNIGGKLHHYGTNVFVMLRTKEGWRISGAFDNHKLANA